MTAPRSPDPVEFWLNHYPGGFAHVDHLDRFVGVRWSRFHGVMVTCDSDATGSTTVYVGDAAVEMAHTILRLAGEQPAPDPTPRRPA